MSVHLTRVDVLFRQRLLACAGLYAGKLDGQWGPKTDAAAAAWDAAFLKARAELAEFDPRTEATLHEILPVAQRLMRRFLADVRSAGIDARAISGTRSYAEQDLLYAQGRTSPGDLVTHARGGQSLHNFGIAIDIGIWDSSGRWLTGDTAESLRPYQQAGKLSVGIDGLEWGGLWPEGREDYPHYQVATGLSLSGLRAAFEAGRMFLRGKNPTEEAG